MSTQHGETVVETRLRKMAEEDQRWARHTADSTIEDIREGEWVDTCADGARQVMNLAHRAEACEIGAEAIMALRDLVLASASAIPHPGLTQTHEQAVQAARSLLQRAGADR